MLPTCWATHFHKEQTFTKFRVFHHSFVWSYGILRRPLLLESTKIIDRDRCHLRFKEALYIMRFKPSLSVTQEALILPMNIRRQHPTRNENLIGAAGIPVRTAEPKRAPEAVATNQCPGSLQQAVPDRVQDLPVPALRRSSHIRHLAAIQRPIGIQDSK